MGIHCISFPPGCHDINQPLTGFLGKHPILGILPPYPRILTCIQLPCDQALLLLRF